ncbi:MAG: GHKL domain-containing protein [Saprospiraceae bacterium]|nr:GHKL domain-containing protein [Saprospiraceae bacterium]
MHRKLIMTEEQTNTIENPDQSRWPRRFWWWIALCVGVWVTASWFDWYQHHHARSNMRESLETWIQVQEGQIDQLANEELIIKTYLLDKQQMPAPIFAAFTERMVRMADLPFSLFYTQHDSLIYWNRGIPGVDASALPQLTDIHQLVPLADGWYLPEHRSISDSINLYALIPVKHSYSTPGPLLHPGFPADPDIPGEVDVVRQPTAHSIQMRDGTILGYLDFSKAKHSLPREYISLILFLLAALITASLAHMIASWMIRQNRNPFGPILFLGTLFGLRFLSLALDFTGHFQQLELFRRSMDNPLLSHSIGDLLINITLLLWIIIFFYRELPMPDFSGYPERRKWMIAFLNYLAIACGLLAMIHLFHILVMDSDITFRFDDIFNFNTYSFLSLLAVQLLLIALFLYSYRILLFIKQTRLPRLKRLTALGLASLLGILTGFLLGLPIPGGWMIGLLIIYLLLFEYYADVRASNLTWIILWMILFSGLASGFLYHFNNQKVDEKLEQYAKILIDPHDAELERQLDNFVSREISEPRISAALNTQTYIKHYYTWTRNLDQSNLDGDPDQWHWQFNTSNYQYEVYNGCGTTLVLQRDESDAKQVYAELLKATPFKSIPDLENFQYQLTREGKRIQSTLSEDLAFSLRDELKPDMPILWFRTKNYQGFRLKQNGFELLITFESGGRAEFLSLFSYLFCLLTITLFLITVLNTIFTFLPDTLNFSLSHRLSLRNRIQFSVISLIVLSFLIIGAITIFYFKNTTEQYHQERLQRKALSVAKDLDNQISKLNNPMPSDMEGILRSISQVHQTDIDLYSDQGQLMYSSEPMVYESQLTSPLMDGRALAAMIWEDKSLFIGENTIGQLAFRTAYAPLPRLAGMPPGYLAIPYYTDRSFLQQDISEFISALLNVYVFLLFIAGALAILVANSITLPISVIGQKLKQFKLGKDNQPLEWSSRDELGDLISEYNRMILKLQESAELLARSEREGAWREMAKQVAHEIKNPLTPMKLSLQHLQLAFKPSKAEDKALLDRVSATLIEQIENLSQIASEFSNFAKIPEAFPEDLVINDLVRSVRNLFGENQDDQIQITTSLPQDDLLVNADKNQLIRVLNNLIKNAIQAIPEDRAGRIHIRLYKKDGAAVIEVEDNGTGIPEEMQEKVFMPNFTTKSSGTGLGLAICRNILDMVGGKLYFRTRPGRGSTFFVELPLEEDQ